MKKIKNLFIILLSACLVNTWPVYAEEQEYVSEEVAAAPHYYSTIEANPNIGVQVVRGDWPSRFKPRVYQAGVISTSVAQDQKAAIKAASFLKKPYSLLSTLTTTDTFYCSQLVYQAYRLGAGVSLPHGLPGIITSSDLLHAGATEVTYRYE